MGPIKTNWPSGTLPPSSGRGGRKARDARERERVAAYIAKQDPDAIRARLACASASYPQRKGCTFREGPTLAELGKQTDPVTRPAATHVPARLGVLPTRKAWRDMQAHVPPHVAAFWAK